MTLRWLTLVPAICLAGSLPSAACAKPPAEEAADRAEKAAERAAKSVERATEAAERAVERGVKDANDKADRERKDAERAARDSSEARSTSDSGKTLSSGDEGRIELAAASSGSGTSGSGSNGSGSSSSSGDTSTSGDGSSKSGSSDGSSGSSGSGSEGSGSSGSGSSGGSSGSGSNSGSGGSDSDNSGPGSNSGSGSDDESGDDDSSGGGGGHGGAIIPVENDGGGNPFREGELVIMSDDANLVTRARDLGFVVIETRPLESIGSVVARLRRPEGVTSSQALELLRIREPASPSGYNYIYRASGRPQDFPQKQPVTSPSGARHTAVIGVIDGFSADAIGGWKVERLVEKPAMSNHGDTVTAILLRDLATSYGSQPDKLILLDVMRDYPGGGAADVAALVFAFDKLVTAHVSVANLSLAGPDNPALRRAVEQSMRSGVVVVAAVGNGGPAAPPAFPAAYDGVVGVSAVDSKGTPYMYAGRGPHVDIAALGFEARSDGKPGELAGTSYAAPHVSALIASLGPGNEARINGLLAQYADDAGVPGRDPVFGVGILSPEPAARVTLATQPQ